MEKNNKIPEECKTCKWLRDNRCWYGNEAYNTFHDPDDCWEAIEE